MVEYISVKYKMNLKQIISTTVKNNQIIWHTAKTKEIHKK
jgi:hypothetical protein